MANPDIQEYVDLFHQGRKPNRAIGHIVYTAELEKAFPDRDFKESQWNDQENNDLFDEGLKVLKERAADLRRGDFILYEPYIGYRDDGKAIFNGTKIINLANEPDDYGTIPEEFQAVIEFPPMYWDEYIDHNFLVPFDVAKNLQNLSVDQVRLLLKGDGSGHLMYPFIVNNKVFYIINAELFKSKHTDPAIRQEAKEFIDKISKEKYFEYYNLNSEIELTPEIPQEQVLIYGSE